ncbi:MAG: hypothetical protein A2W28_00330 [Gammaproteobacteria bacterium RBG_16_51_14]|nr:MAG: hypothetical protein A2W28_00330 [Gammaproteobacteria bacterium RBG_16_51_14]
MKYMKSDIFRLYKPTDLIHDKGAGKKGILTQINHYPVDLMENINPIRQGQVLCPVPLTMNDALIRQTTLS